jgi:predicted RNA-binding protein with PIN domain
LIDFSLIIAYTAGSVNGVFEVMTYIIDGHNLIGVLPDIHLADPDDEARLLERLRAYRARAKLGTGPMIVYFDAGPFGGSPRRETPGSSVPVEARFAEPGQPADDAIVAFLRGVTQPGQYAVVTDDQELTWRVRSLGASSIRASEFAKRLAPRGRRAAPQGKAVTQGGSTGEPTPDPHAPAFADLYAGFMSAEKIEARFGQSPALSAGQSPALSAGQSPALSAGEGVAADVSAWTEKLYAGDAGEAQLAARWLGQHGGKDALEPLEDALTHSDARVRAAALLALGDLGNRRALPALRDRLEHDGASLAREAAAQSLGRLGDRSVESALETAAGADAKSKVRKAARDALAQVRARRAKPPS